MIWGFGFRVWGLQLRVCAFGRADKTLKSQQLRHVRFSAGQVL